MSEKYRRLCATDRKVIRNMKQAGSSQQAGLPHSGTDPGLY
jgi:hypothetical protein